LSMYRHWINVFARWHRPLCNRTTYWFFSGRSIFLYLFCSHPTDISWGQGNKMWRKIRLFSSA
jgi:hypothetical protein